MWWSFILGLTIGLVIAGMAWYRVEHWVKTREGVIQRQRQINEYNETVNARLLKELEQFKGR